MTVYRIYNETGIELLNYNETDILEIQFSDTVKLMIILLISSIIVFTVFGNILVMLAFIVDKRLHTQSNFFLLNLAICDFIIGVFVSPLYVHYLVTGKWVFGSYLCKLWLICDYTMCTASALNVVLISYDRFLSVTKAVLYRSLQNKHRQTVIRMATVWVMSSLLYSPAIMFWESVFGKKDKDDGMCQAGFFDTWYFHLITSCFDFVLPLISISFFNLTIYWNISKRNRKRRQLYVPRPSATKEQHAKPFIIATDLGQESG
ncbi:histamine H3 receptor-like [Pyxicephalus adspersus]|uniref:histamine H3 receptor-like n=1 Tax=Pyxicephalus adspersus TaxID=30357 RepID=UPI003B5CF37E